MDNTKEMIVINANISIAVEALQEVVQNVKKTTKMDAADKISEMISKFLLEKDFLTYTKNINNYK
ncbi:MAG: hypothetical protein B6I31_00670 [Desulfobacteraceae bacterium 4572_19]|nr:MAG: hypothetical protein B6I31_00670 [Desulfobacteraceae bacterium 4572_19]